MAPRSSARWLAPLALAGMIVAIIAVANHSGSGKGGSSTPTTTTVTQPSPRSHKRFYVVRAGDVLSRIAARTGVPLATLQSLNPKLEPDLLQRGQRIKLR